MMRTPDGRFAAVSVSRALAARPCPGLPDGSGAHGPHRGDKPDAIIRMRYEAT